MGCVIHPFKSSGLDGITGSNGTFCKEKKVNHNAFLDNMGNYIQPR